MRVKRTIRQLRPTFVRYWTKADKVGILARRGLSANGPKRTFVSRMNAGPLTLPRCDTAWQ